MLPTSQQSQQQDQPNLLDRQQQPVLPTQRHDQFQQYASRFAQSGRGSGSPPAAVHTQSGLPFGHVPAYLPGSASLVEELDQRLLVVLRDGKHIVGTMISYDQFSNIILQEAVERRVIVVDGVCYCHDIPLGLYILRGDSVVLMGQLDLTSERNAMKQVDLSELEKLRDQKTSVWDFDSDLIA